MRNRRSKKFIDRKVQGQLVLGVAVHWLLFFVMILCAVPMWQIIRVSGFTKPFPAVFAETWRQMIPILVFLAAILPIFIWEMIKFSNRFTGPIYRLHKTIRSIRAGEEFEPIHFRKDDFWHELADDFNAMMEQVGEKESASGSHKDTTEQPQEEEQLVEVG